MSMTCHIKFVKIIIRIIKVRKSPASTTPFFQQRLQNVTGGSLMYCVMYFVRLVNHTFTAK